MDGETRQLGRGRSEKGRLDEAGCYPVKFFGAGSDELSGYDGNLRFAHDGKWFYFELAMTVPDTTTLVNLPAICSHDCWEILMARQKGQPYRCWFVAPDGRFDARSYGEVNWRQDVESKESGHPGFDATCRSDISAPDRWVIRLAIPFGQLAAERVNPGDTIYVNATSVMQGRFKVHPGGQWCGIFTLTPGTTVHTTDRMARVSLEK